METRNMATRGPGENSVFVGNLGESDQTVISSIFQNFGVNP